MRTFGVAVLALVSISAHAALDKSSLAGEAVQQIPVGGGRPNELCVIPQHFADGGYSEKDLENEKKLCGLDKNSTAGVCVKLNSTNPGLDFYSVPAGSTSSQVAQANCNVPESKKLAKYKLSTSCSYVPSILGYYHLGRILDDAGNVPVAVLRTFDLNDHVRLGHIALRRATSTMALTWGSLMQQLPLGARAPKRDLLMTSDFLQSYGALSKNPRGEAKYTEFYNGGSDQEARARNFKAANPVVALLNKRAPVDSFLGRQFNASTVQKLQQMKDASEFIILDSLMNQQDRFGNIHAEEKFFYLDENKKLKSKDDLKADEVASLGAVKAKVMIMKDNDCGGANRPNNIKNAGLVGTIGHMDPSTYQRLLKLNQVIEDSSVKAFFTKNLLFSEADYTMLRRNLREISQQLQQSCRDRKLFLDLDLKKYFTGQTESVSCEI